MRLIRVRLGTTLLRWVAAFVLLLALVRMALPYVIESAVNQRLASINGYHGAVKDIDLSIWRGAYQLNHLTIEKQSEGIPQPLLSADRIDFSVAWRDLFRGELHSDIHIEDASLTLFQHPDKSRDQTPVDSRWQSVIEDLFPISISHLVVENGTVRLVNHTMSDVPFDVSLKQLRIVADDLRNRPTGPDQLPARIFASASTNAGGVVELSGQGDLFSPQLSLDLNFELRDIALPQINDFLRSYANVDVKAGTLSVYGEFGVSEGKFEGYLKPFLEDLDFSDSANQRKPLLDEVWESVVSFFALVFRNHDQEQVGTRIPISGELGDADLDGWSAGAGVIRHAFIEAFSEKIDHSIGPPIEGTSGDSLPATDSK